MEKIKITFSPKGEKKAKISQMFGIPDERAEIMVRQMAEIAKKARDSKDPIQTEQVVKDICELAENPQEAAFCGFTASKVIDTLKEWANNPLNQLLGMLQETLKHNEATTEPSSTEKNG